jgi:hypothetical protein
MDSPLADKEVQSKVNDDPGSGDDSISRLEWTEDEEKSLVKK